MKGLVTRAITRVNSQRKKGKEGETTAAQIGILWVSGYSKTLARRMKRHK